MSALMALTACATPAPQEDPYDPYEAENRKVHEFNRSVDTAAFRPAAQGYGRFVPEPLRMAISNISANLGTPSTIVNDLLQGNMADAGHNSFRFVVNTGLGLGGLFDVATAGGIEERDSDFGETLAVWGVPEGAYLEVPFLGPRTERSFGSNIIDFGLNPLTYVFGPGYTAVVVGAATATALDDRYVLGDTLDQVLYDSADSYALLRSLYLQNRRFELSEGGAVGGDATFDPYEDLYGDIFDE